MLYTKVLLGCYSKCYRGVTGMLLRLYSGCYSGCYRSVTGVLPVILGCYRGITGVLPGCYWGVTGVLPGCYKGVTGVLLGVLPGCYRDDTGVLSGSYRDVTGVLPGCYWGVTGVLLGVLLGVLPGCYRGVTEVLLGWHRGDTSVLPRCCWGVPGCYWGVTRGATGEVTGFYCSPCYKFVISLRCFSLYFPVCDDGSCKCCLGALRSAAACCHGLRATRRPRRGCTFQARPDDASGRCGRRAGAPPTARRPTDGHRVEAGDAQCWRRRRRRRSVVEWRHAAGCHVRRPRPRRCGHGREAYRSRRRDGHGGHRWRAYSRRKHPEQAAPTRGRHWHRHWHWPPPWPTANGRSVAIFRL